MATAVLTSPPTIITICESTTGFSGDTFALNTDFPKQGTNAVACAMTNNGANSIAYATSNSPGGTFSALDKHIRLWANFAFVADIDTDANDGIQISVVSGAGTAYYTVGGSTTYSGGWVQFVIYTGNTPTSGSTPSGTCTSVGFRVNTTAKPRNQPANAYFDAWYYGNGYTITGGTSGDPIDWSHVAALDLIEAYNIVERQEDIYLVSGAVKVGSGATTTYFESAQKIQFTDKDVFTSLYEVVFDGSACNVDITGGSYGAAGSQNYKFDCDVSVNSLSINGVQFEKSRQVFFAAGQTITSAVFDNCGQINPRTATFENIQVRNYVGAEGGAILYPNTDTNISDILITSSGSGYGLELAENGTGTRTFDNITFVGFGADDTTDAMVNYTGTSDFDLAYTGGTQPTVDETSTGTVTVVANQYTVTFTGLVATGEFRLYDDDGDANEITLGDNREGVESLSGTSYILTHPGSQDGDIVRAQFMLPAVYEEQVRKVTLAQQNQTIEFLLIKETNV